MTTFTPIIKFLNNWGPLLDKIIAVLLPVWVTMKIGQKIAIMNQERLKSNTDAMWNLGNKLNKLALAQGYGAGEQGMPMKSGLFALFGGPWGAAITLGIGLISLAKMTNATDRSADALESIDSKTPDPEVASSLFANQTSSLLKSTVLSTILGGNALLEALNTSNAETATRVGSLVDILLADKTAIRASIGGRTV